MERRKSDSRTRVNRLNVLITCAVLFFAVQLSDGSFIARINKISEHLDKALYDVLELGDVNYTELNSNVTYYSTTYFNARGMGVLYNATSQFMDLIVSRTIFPEGVIKVVNGRLEFGLLTDQWQPIVTHYAGLLTILIVLVVFALLMPLCGLIFCCCRCCGNCGARSKPFDKKHDLCKKIILATLLIALGTLMLFGVVCAFVSNQHLQDGTDEITETVSRNIKDVDTYLDTTKGEVATLLDVNYQEFRGVLFEILDKCSDIVLEQLAEYSQAVAVTEVVNIVQGLEDIRKNLTFMRVTTNDLRVNASQLNDGLRKVKGDLLQALHNCASIPKCSELSNDYVSRLGTNIDFDSLPDIKNEIDQLEGIINSQIVNTVQDGKNAFEGIKNQINQTISDQIPKVKSSIQQAGKELKSGSENVTAMLDKAKSVMHKYTDEPLHQAGDYISLYSQYRLYVGVTTASMLLLVTLCITLGLICGICGKRPDAYSDDCCNKGAGSRFLMIGVGLMFLFPIVLALATIIYFLVGMLAQRVVCDSLRHSSHSELINLMDQVINLNNSLNVNSNISSIISSCHRNESVYSTLRLENMFSVGEVEHYLEEFNINSTLQDLESKINATVNVTIMSDEAKRQLMALVDSGIADISYNRFSEVLAHNLTSVDLIYLTDKLEELLEDVSQIPSAKSVETSLRLSVLHLRMYQAKLVAPMTVKAKEMIAVAESLEEGLKFNRTSFEHAIKSLIKECEDAQEYLKVNGSQTMQKISQEFAHGLEKHVRAYLNRVVNNTVSNVGRCGPLSLVFNSTLTLTCDKILLPLNGYWFSIFWCLLLFIPTIILSVKLATLYQKYDAYPGPLVEAEYLYDAYTDRDNIPLASTHGKRANKKFTKKKKHYDGRGAYAPEAGDPAIPAPGGSHYQDARYADMAPKHWEEFPAGGPPQYHRTPTEYERPPPYYYPGNSEPGAH